MTDRYYLQDARANVGDRMMFWLEGGGYTSNVRDAEVFPREEAVRQHQSRESDIPWPVEYIDARTERACDCQYVNEEAAEKELVRGLCYIQVPGRWNGNDLMWLRREKGISANLDEAASMFVDTGAELCGSHPGYVAWPVDYIDSLSRWVVASHRVNVVDALQGSGIELVEPQRPRKEVINCHGCGRFIAENDIWAGACSNCGTDNYP